MGARLLNILPHLHETGSDRVVLAKARKRSHRKGEQGDRMMPVLSNRRYRLHNTTYDVGCSGNDLADQMFERWMNIDMSGVGKLRKTKVINPECQALLA